jgi:O-antigen chain-terminating methyltransferase
MTSESPDSPAGSTDLLRLRHEREAADRAYNEALTSLDRAIQELRSYPAAPPPMDESQLAALNERWQLMTHAPSTDESWLRRVRRVVWEMAGPLFRRQEQFNATVVDHINRNVATTRDSSRAVAELLQIVRDEFARLAAFQSTLVQYAQTVTAYVDTKDRCVEALPYALHGAIEALSDEMEVRSESAAARERRMQSEVEEIRTTLGVAHRAILTLKRELEHHATAGAASPQEAAATSAALNSYKYVGFEDQFRGLPVEIRERMAVYVPAFEGCRDVLDIGCGRGEFLDLLREAGITARGVDLNDEMVGICRDRGLDATTMDALSYLRAQPDESLGGLFGAQVVEHLEPDYLMRLLETAFHKLRPGSVIVLETINPACWFAFFSSYIRDITHVRPLHPDTLRYLVLASGFQQASIRYSAPYPDGSKLQPIDVPGDSPLAEAARVFNDNAEKLNGLLFTYLDYAVMARKS